jgi:uncharacterized membrane protein YGL010W
MDGKTDSATRLKLRLAQYGKSHQVLANRLIHKICVPAIMLSLIGLLQCIPGPIPWEALFILGSFVYYIQFRSLKIYGIILLQIIPMLYLLSRMGSDKILICGLIFVVAWLGQFFGHRIEGKKPSSVEDIQYLWIGPIWIFLGS